MPMAKNDGARLSVKLTPKATVQLQELAQDATLTNAVHRAIELLYLASSLGNREVLIIKKDALGQPKVEKIVADRVAGPLFGDYGLGGPDTGDASDVAGKERQPVTR